jgi:hypothetical protein
VAGTLAGAALVGAAGAAVVLSPVGTGDVPPGQGPSVSPEAAAVAAGLAAQAAEVAHGSGDPLTPPDLSGLSPLPPGELLVGAAATSIAPDPDRWQTEGCSVYVSNFPEEVDHLAHSALAGEPGGWPRSPDCVYLGGYGIGPARPATSVDPQAGVHVRTLAISNGADTLIWQVFDVVGWFARYRPELCDGCGILDLRRRIEAETGIPAAHVAIGNTHTHGGADGYGAWGGLPRWYREQVRDAVLRSAYDALRSLRPAVVEIGSTDARAFSNERRGTYYSAADYGAVWLQARTMADPPEVIATLVNFAAHPTMLGAQPVMHGDWPATAAHALGARFGGVGLVFPGGLGNVSPRQPLARGHDVTGDGAYDQYDRVVEMGEDLAAFVATGIAARGGHRLASNEIRAENHTIEHPITNWGLQALGVVRLLDRELTPGDAAGAGGAYRWSKRDGQGAVRSCATAAPLTVKADVTAHRVGELRMVTGPGEIFSTIANVVKSKTRADALTGGQVMVFGQTQESLGYIVQSFEVDAAGGVTSGTGAAEYEETFMPDRCFGDHVLDTQLGLLARLG